MNLRRRTAMERRPADVCLAALALLLLLPVLMVAALGIVISDPGPILYRARRVGRNGCEFEMFKLRSMRAATSGSGPRITATRDSRVFPFGELLRLTKVDELPQLLNVLRGDMCIIGPRPEDPTIVAQWYTNADRETLECPPGLSSPGSVYQYTHGDELLDSDDPEGAYHRALMPIKLALDRVYVRRRSLSYDARIVGRTIRVLFMRLLGRRRFPEPPEMGTARRLLATDPQRMTGSDKTEAAS